MTTTAEAPLAVSTRAAGAIVLIAGLGPFAIALLRGLLPYSTLDDSSTVAAQVAADPGTQGAVLWLSYLALLTLPLGVLIVSWLAVRTRPVLGWVAAVVAWLGFMSLFFTISGDQVAQAGATAGLPPSDVATILDATLSLSVVSLASTVFVVGHILGTVLLGVALWRVIPRWAAVALIVSQPLHLVFAVVMPNAALDGAAWLLTGIGFVAAAITLTRVDAIASSRADG